MDLFDSLSFGDLLQGPNATRTVAYLRRVLERVSTEHRVALRFTRKGLSQDFKVLAWAVFFNNIQYISWSNYQHNHNDKIPQGLFFAHCAVLLALKKAFW